MYRTDRVKKWIDNQNIKYGINLYHMFPDSDVGEIKHKTQRIFENGLFDSYIRWENPVLVLKKLLLVQEKEDEIFKNNPDSIWSEKNRV